MHWKLDNQTRRWNHYYIIKRTNLYANLTQYNLKDKVSDYPCVRLQLVSLYLILLQSKRSYSKLFKMHFFVLYDALNGSFVEQCVSH
jgi:hypothetical protein